MFTTNASIKQWDMEAHVWELKATPLEPYLGSERVCYILCMS